MLSALSFLALPHAQAHEADGSSPPVEVDLSDMAPKSVQDLGRDFFTSEQLKKVIPKTAYEDGQSLSQAFEAFYKKDYAGCLGHLKSISSGTLFSEYRIFLETSCLKAQGKHEAALVVLGDLPVPSRSSSKITREVFWLKLDVLAELKRTSEVQKGVGLLFKEIDPDRLMQAHAAYVIGKSHLRSGQQQPALKEFQKAVLTHVGTEYDERIFAEIVASGLTLEEAFTEAQWNMRAINLISNKHAYRATRLYQNLMRWHGSKGSYEERLANSVFNEKRYVLAAEMYEKILKDGVSESSHLSLLVSLSQAYARSDQFDAAIRVNQQIVREYPNTNAASLAKNKLGFLYFDAKQYEQAIAFYRSNSKATDAGHYLFWSYYLSGKFEAALKAISGIKGGQTPRLYWSARIYERLGKADQARSYYQKVRQANGDGYWGLLAEQRLSNGKLFPRSMIDPALLNHLPKIDSEDSPQVGTTLENPNLIRGAMLYAMGQDLFAFDESRALAGAKSLTMDQLAALSLSGNDHKGWALLSSAKNGGISDCDVNCAWSLGYPRAYQKYGQKFTKHWNIPEALAYAVMRQESTFKPEAFSYAYANGLMQIIPPTGDEIADRIGYKNFHPEQLTDPRINTLFGTYYLSHLLNLFHNNLVYAIAGYNAGPDAVGRWVKRYGNLEMDEFVELIAYAQTRDYVRKVLLNYLSYDRLYFR